MASLKKRGKYYHLQYYVAAEQQRISLKTKSYQIAKEKLRQFESARFQGINNPLPTKTPIPEVIEKYIKHIQSYTLQGSKIPRVKS